MVYRHLKIKAQALQQVRTGQWYQPFVRSGIEQNEVQKVQEDITSEYIGIINYCVISLIQNQLTHDTPMEIPAKEVSALFDKYIHETKNLMENNNHVYGEAWRDMRVSSITDLILMKILRLKQIEDMGGKTLISEGVDANYMDMINYAVFASIKIKEATVEQIN